MNKFRLIKADNYLVRNHNQSENIILHDNIMDMLFGTKKEISYRLSDIIGMFNIDYISIIILKSNRLYIFSTTPSIEFNLIAQNLLQHDKCYAPNLYPENTLFFWDEAYDGDYFCKIKKIKEINNNYTFGFGLTKQINNLQLTYSFATRSQEKNMSNYYLKNKLNLSKIGDYGFTLIKDIYAKYQNNFRLNSIKPDLRLIINNK